MTSDPETLTVAAAAGAFGAELVRATAKDAYSLLKRGGKSTIDRIRQRLDGPALQRADQNLQQFDEILTLVQARDEKILAERSVAVQDPGEAIEDPDKFRAFQIAASSAARTSSSERHRLLAEALSMRFRADSNEEKAMFMNRAVEVISELGPRHLDVLGFLACVHGIRHRDSEHARWQAALDEVYQRANELYPKNRRALEALSGDERKAATQAHNEESEAIIREAKPFIEKVHAGNAARAARIIESLALHKSGWSASDQDVLHLSAAGCVVVERAVYRDLGEQCADSKIGGGADRELASAVNNIVCAESFVELRGGWERTLQHCAVTPVGFIIGLMVHDRRADTSYAHEWEWGVLQPHDRPRDTWNGLTPREITDAIVKETKSSIADETRRLDMARGIVRR